jgi:signal transduction histidine kinase
MKLCLISTSHELREVCEAAAEAGPPVEVVVTTEAAAAADADVVLWDVSPGATPPAETLMTAGRQHLVAVDANAADGLRNWEPGAPLLLKPIRPDVLRPFLIAAAQRRRTPSNGTSERRTSFLSRAARELRGPLSALNGYCALLLDRKVGGALSPTQSDVVERMHDSVRHASRIAEGLCSATSVPGTGDRAETIPLDECIRAAMADAKFVIDGRQVAIELLVERFAEQTLFAPARLRYALAAIVEYACVNSPRSGTVRISAYPVVREGDGTGGRAGNGAHANAYRIDVCDSGRPMSIGELNALFDESGDYQPAPPRLGTFGLAITKKIISGLGGTIFPESTAAGVTISVVVPWRSLTGDQVQLLGRAVPALSQGRSGGQR